LGVINDGELREILDKLILDDDGIYSYAFNNTDQEDEVKTRISVADEVYDDYLSVLSQHHSIPVMDKEVRFFCDRMPKNAKIIDVGGCWGWHWRNISKIRPDIKIFIVDFIKDNLHHAKNILKEDVNQNVFLIHGDATDLIFDDVFDGYWSVQTLQHIPNFKKTILEAHRVLKKGGLFVNYSLNNQFIIRFIYKLFGKEYIVQGNSSHFYLSRASQEQKDAVGEVFGQDVQIRHSEIIFKPELKISFSGKEKSIFGVLDSYLSNNVGFLSSIARQQSYHVYKA